MLLDARRLAAIGLSLGISGLSVPLVAPPTGIVVRLVTIGFVGILLALVAALGYARIGRRDTAGRIVLAAGTIVAAPILVAALA